MKKWKIFLIQHSHVDIGYTERQEKIEAYQGDFIRQAVDNAIDNMENPKKYKEPFRFTCESFWAVEKYLDTYGAEGEQRLLRAIRSGHIELTAFYLHNAELLTRNNYVSSLGRAREFADRHGIKLTTALCCDVNGFPWSMADLLADNGNTYLMTCINTHHGGAPFGKPLVPFYWQGPEGKKVLVWNGLTYHKANLLGLIPGPNPMGDAGIPGMERRDDGTQVIKDITQSSERVYAMVKGLEEIGYSYDFLPIMGSGLYTDNSPVTMDYLSLIDEWNEAHGDQIEIVTATVEDFFKHLEKEVTDIPTYTGDWNDWWTDGTISTPMEVKTFRHAQRLKDVVDNLNTSGQVSDEELRAIEKKLYLFAEHTWGHSASESQPWDFLVNQVEFRNAMHAYNADQMVSSALDKVMKTWGEGEFRVNRPMDYSVVNPMKDVKKDAFLLPVDFWEVPGKLSDYYEDYYVVDDRNRAYPFQVVETLRGVNLCVVDEVGGLEQKDFRILHKPEEVPVSVDGAKAVKVAITDTSYENDWYKVMWDEKGITSIYCKESNQQLLSEATEQSLGKPVYQIFKGGKRSDAAGFGYSSRSIPDDTVYGGEIRTLEMVENGPVLMKLKLVYEVEGAHTYVAYMTFYHELPVIDLNFHVTKTIETDPEGLYIEFPFKLKDALWEVEKQGVFIRPGKDQLPVTCCDYYNVSHGLRLTNGDYGIGMSVLDAPMVMFNDLNLWKFSTETRPDGIMYSWLTNNKWETNFKIQCGGMYDFRYRIAFGKALADSDEAYKTIYNNSYELLAVRH